MDEHLPECTLTEVEPLCICDNLREFGRRIVGMGAGVSADIEFGRQEGLREAREAVEALMHHGRGPSNHDIRTALAAIDALRGEA